MHMLRRVLHGSLPSLCAGPPVLHARCQRLHAAAADTVLTQLETAASKQQQQQQAQPKQPRQRKQQQQQGAKGSSSDTRRITPKSEDFSR